MAEPQDNLFFDHHILNSPYELPTDLNAPMSNDCPAASIGCILHVCCAPCLAAALETIRRDSRRPLPALVGLFFYNPNIHPLLEFRRRVKALRVYLERKSLAAEIDGDYGLHEFLTRIAAGGAIPGDRRERCARCYRLRLEKTAAHAAGMGAAAFSTTLLASREQDRDLVAEAGREAAARHGLQFIDADLRAFLPDDRELRGIYKQQYCGCVFSEEERYRNTGKHLWAGADAPPKIRGTRDVDSPGASCKDT